MNLLPRVTTETLKIILQEFLSNEEVVMDLWQKELQRNNPMLAKRIMEWAERIPSATAEYQATLMHHVLLAQARVDNPTKTGYLLPCVTVMAESALVDVLLEDLRTKNLSESLAPSAWAKKIEEENPVLMDLFIDWAAKHKHLDFAFGEIAGIYYLLRTQAIIDSVDVFKAAQ